MTNHVTVEVEVERTGLFVKVSRVYMCESLDVAKNLKAEKSIQARKIIELQKGADWLEIEEDGDLISTRIHNGKK